MRNTLELAMCEGGSCGSLRQMAPLQLAARLLSAAGLVALAAACDPKPAESFTIHVNHQPNDPRSVAAKDCLKKALCAKFGIAPCVVDAEGAASKLHLRADLSVSVPAARFQPVMGWMQQRRLGRLGCGFDLDLALHPNSGCPALDLAEHSVYVGQRYPANMNAIYASGGGAVAPAEVVPAAATADDDDAWAFKCSDDASALCGKGPFAPNTTCRDSPLGTHLHLFYSANDAASVAAKDKFFKLASAALGLPSKVCADDYGHEQPHNHSCFLTGPGGKGPLPERSYPQDHGGSSFAASCTSLYIIDADFAKALSFIMVHKTQAAVGLDLDFLLHPCFGCSYADHQDWSMRSGMTPNNMNGIAAEGGYDAEQPNAPDLDPLSDLSAEYGACTPATPINYSLHLLYNPVDAASVAAKAALLKAAQAKFAAALTLVGDVPKSFLDPKSQFLGGSVHLIVQAPNVAAVLLWAAANRGATDVLLAPNSGCAYIDYAQSAMYVGEPWPYNLGAFKPGRARPLLPSAAAPRAAAAAAPPAPPTTPLVVYVLRAPNNNWQKAAWGSLLDKFAAAFEVPRKDCAGNWSTEPAAAGKAMCMGAELQMPYKLATNGMTTSYTSIFVPAADANAVLNWFIVERAAHRNGGYSVDVMAVPLTGDAAGDYGKRAVRAFGGSQWRVNSAVLKSDDGALQLPASVAYYLKNTSDSTHTEKNGVVLLRWDSAAAKRAAKAAAKARGISRNNAALPAAGPEGNDWALSAPYLTQIYFPAGAAPPEYPESAAEFGGFFLKSDAYYVVLTGEAQFGEGAGNSTHAYGDVFWVMAGEKHGPIVNLKPAGNLTLAVVTTAPFMAHVDAAPKRNPSVDEQLTPSRSYLQLADPEDWSENPSPHTEECDENGGVQNMGFGAAKNTPAVLRVRWSANCSIPYHYHPTGAMYFILYGQMLFKGDLPFEVLFNRGDVRWVRPGFSYGPEYNANAPMQITVIGTETPPTFIKNASYVPMPYKYQKTTTVTHVYTESGHDEREL